MPEGKNLELVSAGAGVGANGFITTPVTARRYAAKTRYPASDEPHVLLVFQLEVEDGMGTSQNGAALRAARNQSLFRAINERIEEVNESFRLALDEAKYVCECADNDCMDRIALTPEEYQEVRRVPTHFVIRREHVHPYFETVIKSHDGYVVVEKFGEAGAAAVALARESLANVQGQSA